MSDSRPNILLLVTDQHRGDCLGIEGHPVQQTPHLDMLAAAGVRFRHAYAACPVCIPARRTLMTGRRPQTHGALMNYGTWLNGPTLPGELSKAGYQAHLVGKLHLWPPRKLYGFDSADWSDKPDTNPRRGPEDDYQRFLRHEGVTAPWASMGHGIGSNNWVGRAWHMDERLHFSNWCADRAIEFVERRDPTQPFFLKVSFLHPHQPCTPPQFYYDRYMNMDLPEPFVGDWARVFDGPQRGMSPMNCWRACFEPQVIKQARAAYYGSINHIDDQIDRILTVLPANTIVLFTADHGEMLGDHQWLRKRNAYEPSARIPLLMYFPKSAGLSAGQVIDAPVELMDIMPTLLDAADAPIPETVEGRSMLSLIRGDSDWREYVHGECSSVPTLDSGMQYLTDGRRKYIWLPGPGVEQYFDLENDPNELRDLANEPGSAEEIAYWRGLLVRELEGRPEGFTDGRELKRLGKATAPCMPGFETPDWRPVQGKFSIGPLLGWRDA